VITDLRPEYSIRQDRGGPLLACSLLVVGVALLFADVLTVLLAVAAIFIGTAIVLNLRVAWISLFLVFTLNGIRIGSSDLVVRPELLVLPLFTVSLLLHRRDLRLRGSAMAFASVYVTALAYASLVIAPNPQASLWICFQIAMAVLLFLLISSSGLERRFVEDGTRVVGAVAGISCVGWLLYRVGIVGAGSFGVGPDGRLIGFSIETNIFAAQCVGWLAVLAARGYGWDRRGQKLAVVAIFLAVLLAGTRSAWIGLALLIVFVGWRYVASNAKKLGVVLLAAPLLVLPTAASLAEGSSDPTSLQWRLQNLTDFSSGTGFYRVQIYEKALEDISVWPHWLIGTGVNSYSQFHPIDVTNRYAEYLGNFWLVTPYDGGLVALAGFVGLMVVSIRGSGSSARWVAFICIMLCAAITNIMWFQFAWAYLALAFAGEPSHERRTRDAGR
jgi:O-Antigen ligase